MEELIALLPSMAQNYLRPQTPAPMKMMAASGSLPIPPQHLGLLLVCLAYDANEQVAQRAQMTFSQQPPPILRHLLENPKQHPTALNYVARQFIDKEELIQLVLLHRNTPTEALEWLAPQLDGRLLELLAQNQQRQMESPRLVQALISNPNLRTDNLAKVVEFALRNGVETGIPTHVLKGIVSEELLRELGIVSPEAATQDALLSVSDEELFENPELILDPAFALSEEIESEKYDDDELLGESKRLTLEQILLQMTVTEKIKAAIRGNKQVRGKLITDSNRLVSGAVLKNPRITESEVIKIAASRSVSEDIIRGIARNREWMKVYHIKVSLVNNPKCPTGVAVRLVNHLRPSDLRNLAGNKNVPSTVAATAKKMMNTKQKNK